MSRTIQHKRGLEKNLPQLKVGEFALTTDTKKVFVGTDNGNVEVTNKAAVENLTGQLAEKADKGEYRNPLNQIKGQIYEYPTFTKIEQNPVLTRNDCRWMVDAGYKMYWPWMVHMEPILGDAAIDKFYLYYSSDHGGAAGGIGLATSPTPTGPFTDKGRIYVDSVEGNSTETPSVIWNESTNKFHMYYHNYGAGREQSSLLATSDDGVNWTRYGIVIDVPDIEFPGDGHTGYMHVYKFGKTWVAHHLMGGGGTYHFGISYSKDGFKWQTDPRPVLGFADLTDDPLNKRVEYISLHPFNFRGNIWSAFTVSPYEFGLNTTAKEMYVGRMDDPRKLYNLQFIFSGKTGGWDEKALKQPHIMEYEGKLYMYYAAAGTDGNGAIGIAIGEA